MARIVEPLPPRGRTVYPWAEWLDGQAREVRRGEDYDVSHSSFRTVLYGAASRAGGHARTRHVVEGGDQVGWVIQFSRNGDGA